MSIRHRQARERNDGVAPGGKGLPGLCLPAAGSIVHSGFWIPALDCCLRLARILAARSL